MHTLHLPEAGRRRRSYSAEFKAKIVAACQQPGASIASIALANQINPNLVRRWVHLQQPVIVAPPAEMDIVAINRKSDHSTPSSGALVPVIVSDRAVQTRKPGKSDRPQLNTQGAKHRSRSAWSSSTPPPSTEPIQIELRRGNALLKVAWPATQADSCAHWLRELWQ